MPIQVDPKVIATEQQIAQTKQILQQQEQELQQAKQEATAPVQFSQQQLRALSPTQRKRIKGQRIQYIKQIKKAEAEWKPQAEKIRSQLKEGEKEIEKYKAAVIAANKEEREWTQARSLIERGVWPQFAMYAPASLKTKIRKLREAGVQDPSEIKKGVYPSVYLEKLMNTQEVKKILKEAEEQGLSGEQVRFDISQAYGAEYRPKITAATAIPQKTISGVAEANIPVATTVEAGKEVKKTIEEIAPSAAAPTEDFFKPYKQSWLTSLRQSVGRIKDVGMIGPYGFQKYLEHVAEPLKHSGKFKIGYYTDAQLKKLKESEVSTPYVSAEVLKYWEPGMSESELKTKYFKERLGFETYLPPDAAYYQLSQDIQNKYSKILEEEVTKAQERIDKGGDFEKEQAKIDFIQQQLQDMATRERQRKVKDLEKVYGEEFKYFRDTGEEAAAAVPIIVKTVGLTSLAGTTPAITSAVGGLTGFGMITRGAGKATLGEQLTVQERALAAGEVALGAAIGFGTVAGVTGQIRQDILKAEVERITAQKPQLFVTERIKSPTGTITDKYVSYKSGGGVQMYQSGYGTATPIKGTKFYRVGGEGESIIRTTQYGTGRDIWLARGAEVPGAGVIFPPSKMGGEPIYASVAKLKPSTIWDFYMVGKKGEILLYTTRPPTSDFWYGGQQWSAGEGYMKGLSGPAKVKPTWKTPSGTIVKSPAFEYRPEDLSIIKITETKPSDTVFTSLGKAGAGPEEEIFKSLGIEQIFPGTDVSAGSKVLSSSEDIFNVASATDTGSTISQGDVIQDLFNIGQQADIKSVSSTLPVIIKATSFVIPAAEVSRALTGTIGLAPASKLLKAEEELKSKLYPVPITAGQLKEKEITITQPREYVEVAEAVGTATIVTPIAIQKPVVKEKEEVIFKPTFPVSGITPPPPVPPTTFIPGFGIGVFDFGAKKKRAPPKMGITKPKEGYNALVKQGKRYYRANINPITKKQAKDLGSNIVDTTLSATFKIKKAGKPAKKPKIKIPKGYFERTKKKYRDFKLMKGKKKYLNNKWIEKKRNRLDTPTEVKKITALAKISKMKKDANIGIPKPKKAKPFSIKTPGPKLKTKVKFL